MGSDEKRGTPQPLTRRNSAGELLRRDSIVDKQIARALALGETELLTCMAIGDTGNPTYLQEEALVHLIRRARERGQVGLLEKLTACLLGRCTAYIGGIVYKLSPEEKKDAFQEVVSALLDRLWDLDTDRGDYLEVRFWLFLRRLASDVLRRHYSEQKRAIGNVPLDAPVAVGDGADEELGISYRLAMPGLSPEEKLLLRDALGVLPEPLRTVFVLRHYAGWPVEDRDPSVVTISNYYRKTSRTIRNWLGESERLLEGWRGEAGNR